MTNQTNIMLNFISAITLLLLLPSWAIAKDNKDSKSQLQIVATIKPIHAMVSAVLGDLGKPTLLIDSNNSAHDYNLKPSDIKHLQSADIIFFVSMDLENFLIHKISSLKKGAMTVELAASNGVIRNNAISSIGDSHLHSAFDPHIWLNPQNAIAIVKQIEKVLSTKDRDNRGIYAVNAREYINKISTMSEKITLQLSPFKNIPFITFHDAYGYFSDAYDLNQIAAVSVNPEIALGAKTVKKFNKIIKNKHIYCVFADPAFTPDMLKKIINDPSKIKIKMLDPQGVYIKPGPQAYISIMNNITTTLLSCFKNE